MKNEKERDIGDDMENEGIILYFSIFLMH